MKNLYYILQKEFRLIFRDKAILRLIFMMPVMQLILIPLAADYEVKHISIAIIDQDRSSDSQRLVQKIGSSNYFNIVATPRSYRAATELVERGGTDVVLTIPPHFARDWVNTGRAQLQLAADAVNGVRAGLGTSYALSMVREFEQELRRHAPSAGSAPSGGSGSAVGPSASGLPSVGPKIEVTTAAWYNPHVDYPAFMVPGVLGILVTMVGAFLSALNIVQEKEAGTIEQINVTPIRKVEFILGKLIPFWVLGMVSITLGILVALVIFGLWPEGSLGAIYVFSALYLVGVLGIGLFISTITESQQQATLISFFVMMIFVLLGGLYTPIESMPPWAQAIAAMNPPSYFIEMIRAVYIKGSTLGDMLPSLAKLGTFAVGFNSLAVWSYRKRNA